MTPTDSSSDVESERNQSDFGAINDKPSSEDDLNFRPFVEAVLSFITAPGTKPPITISIEGPWGSGKSTFMRHIEEELQSQDSITVNFNPWRYDGEDVLWAEFALELIKDIESQTAFHHRLLSRMELSYRRIKHKSGTIDIIEMLLSSIILFSIILTVILLYYTSILSTVPSYISIPNNFNSELRLLLGTGGLATAALATIKIISYLTTITTDPLYSNIKKYINNPDYENRTSFISDFHDDIERILDVYLSENERVYVFIDDVDRCQMSKSVDMMQSIHLMLTNDDRIVFLIAIDRDRVAAGIGARNEDHLEYLPEDEILRSGTRDYYEDGRELDYGYSYLEKLIQIPLLIPEPREEEIVSLIMQKANYETEYSGKSSDRYEISDEIKKLESEILPEISDMVAQALNYNPRQAVRFLNLFRLRLLLAESVGLLDIYISDNKNSIKYDENSLTAFQLAKFVTISLQWPRLLSKISTKPDLLGELEDLALNGSSDVEATEDTKWSNDESLMRLLRYGQENDNIRARYSVDDLEIDKLLKISPRADRPTKTIESSFTIQVAFISSKDKCFNVDPKNLIESVFQQYEQLRVDCQFSTISQLSNNSADDLLGSSLWIIDSEEVYNGPMYTPVLNNIPYSAEIIMYSDKDSNMNSQIILKNLERETNKNIKFVRTLEELTAVLKAYAHSAQSTPGGLPII